MTNIENKKRIETIVLLILFLLILILGSICVIKIKNYLNKQKEIIEAEYVDNIDEPRRN